MSSRFALLLGTVTAVAAALAFLSFDHPWALRGDNKLVLFPLTLDAYRQWMEGHIPFWSSGLWAGYPLLADCTAGALYLPHLLPFLLTPDPHLRAFDLSTALHLGILVTGTVRLLEHLGSTRLTATFAALLTLMAPHVLGWTHFQPGICALSWWPWVMLCAQRLSETERFSFGDATCGSACLALQVLAGYPELALYNGCFAAGWLLTNRKGVPLARRLSRVLVLGLGALLLAAPQLIPTALEIPDTIRAGGVADLPRLSVELESGAAVVDPRVAVDAFPLLSPFELLLRVFLFERDIQGLLENLGHLLLSVLNTQDFRQSFELIFEFLIGRESEVEFVGSRRLENGRRALLRRGIERRSWRLRGGFLGWSPQLDWLGRTVPSLLYHATSYARRKRALLQSN